MAHEITGTDNAVYTKERAWHGLGIVVPEALAPIPALELIGADWGVRQCPVWCDWVAADGTSSKLSIPDRVANVREDTGAVLGEVSASCYRSFSNREVAEFCEALLVESETGQTRVRIESAGTIRGGAKLWFLLQGEMFQLGKGDQVVPYVLVSNGHDGKTSLRVTPTTIRVECSNTLHMVIPQDDTKSSGRFTNAAIVIQHTGDLASKVAEAQRALGMYDVALQMTREAAERLAEKPAVTADLIRYFVERYSQDFELPETGQTAKVNDRRERRMEEAREHFADHFRRNVASAGASWWNAFNAYSEFVQHDTQGRGRDDLQRVERRMQSNLFGLGSARTLSAFDAALVAAGV